VSQIWIDDPTGKELEKIPQPPARSNDTDPMWIGTAVYFRSDRSGEFNIYSYEPRTKAVRQITRYADFPILNAAAGGGKIAFEQAGYLHIYDPATSQSKRLKIGVAADLPEARPRFASGARWIRGATLSPTGARAAFEFRGEIVTVPAEKGDPRNLTNTTQWHERTPAWSPDGQQVAYFSDEGGEYTLRIAGQDGKAAVRTLKVPGNGFYSQPSFSPDGKKLSYVDNSQSLYWVDLKTGTSTRIDGHRVYTPQGVPEHSWSPDSKWIAYVVNLQPLVTAVHLYSVDQKKTFQVTDGLGDVADPVFDRSGKYLYFFGSTNAGPAVDWFAQSNADMQFSRNVYLMVLRNDLPSPLARESDEEKPVPAKPPGGGRGETAKPPAAEPVRVDLDGIQFRILDMPIPAGQLSNLETGTAGLLYFQRTSDSRTSLERYDLNVRRTETLLPEAGTYTLSADGKKLLYTSGPNWSIVSTTARIDPAAGRVEANLRGSVAHQPRLLLRAEHARRGLGRDEDQIRAVPGRSRHAKRPQPRHPVDVVGALGRPPPRRRRRHAGAAQSGAGRTPRRRLQRGERPLSLQEGLRRPQLESAAALAAHRARRQRSRGRVPAGRPRAGGPAARQRVQLLREHRESHRRDHRRPERGRQRIADRLGGAGRQRGRAPQS